MRITEEILWGVLERKAKEEDEKLQPDQRIANEYLSGVKSVCEFGVDRSKTIRDNFPMYTLHDETHICNVLRNMASLLGGSADDLSRDEAAMLILAACCHDIGMSCSGKEKAELLSNTDRLNQYLERNHSEYVKAYAASPDEPKLTDEMLQRYLRSIHHERAAELLGGIEWPAELWGRVDRDDLVRVCQSHGESLSDLNGWENTPAVDLRFCAVLLRLADILDFDTSRAPKAVYDYSGLNQAEGSGARISRDEWKKHMASQGFDFSHVSNRQVPYDLPYHATSESMQIEQTVNSYLDWVDCELNECSKLVRRYTGNWQNFILPSKVKRTIKTQGYVSGQYHLTMDQDQIMELLVGEELYSDPSVFVRELIQNAIDAVRTREQLDKNLPRDWKSQINIRCWMDEEGYHWFRIEDNGTGMTEDIIKNYFLKIGSSYYTSNTFQKEKIRCRADPDYTPISRFGIGILSCFMGGEDSNWVEVSTKRFGSDGERPSALRLSMHGMNGYYYLASQREGHRPSPMNGVTDAEKRPYLQTPGTVVAVRTNLYQTGKYTGFKEIVDRYVVYPPVPIHYDGAEGTFDYATKSEFMDVVHGIHPSENRVEQGVIEIPMTEEQCREVSQRIPGLVFDVPPKVILRCVPLDRYTESPYLTGAVLTAKLVGSHGALRLKFEDHAVSADVNMDLKVNDARDAISIRISLSFPEKFGRTIADIRERFQDKENILREMIQHLMQLYEGGFIQKEIIRIPRGQYVSEPEQEDWKITGKSLPSIDELKMLEKFERYRKSCEVPICNLHDYEWYQNYFCNLFERVCLRDIAAHNGILCGDSRFLFDKELGQTRLGTILLLQDKYRPGLDVARLGIRELSLEMSCDFALIKTSLRQEGFSDDERQGCLLKGKPSMVPASMYQSLLARRPDLEKRLVFTTDKGCCGCSKLKEFVAAHKRLCLKSSLCLAGEKYNEQRQLRHQLCLTYLKQNYDLRMVLNQHCNEIYIMEKAERPAEEDDRIFPVALFLYPDTKCAYLTTGYAPLRYFCNADHRFSRFMLKNGRLLQQKVPGILKELVRALREESGDSLVRTINDLLVCLRNLPGRPIEIPDSIFLTRGDLC